MTVHKGMVSEGPRVRPGSIAVWLDNWKPHIGQKAEEAAETEGERERMSYGGGARKRREIM